MKFTTPFALLFVAIGLVQAGALHHPAGVARRSSGHAHHARAVQQRAPDLGSNGTLGKRTNSKRCKPRSTTSSLPVATPNVDAQKTSSKPSSTSASHPTSSPSSSGNGGSGTIQLDDPKCGPNGATTKISATAGPNGDIDWLNCGIDGAGWTPPKITVDNVIAKDLKTALQDPNSPFKACSAYIDLFYKYAGQYNVPPILVASIAMQESSCDPSTVGGGGEQGLMQITRDKCGGQSDSACRNPDYNIKTGVKYFSDTLDQNDGNLLLTVGMYNGWYQGLTIAKAEAARHSSCCRCQNNLDYLDQTFNGWLQNYDPYQHHMGKYFNLDVCGNDS